MLHTLFNSGCSNASGRSNTPAWSQPQYWWYFLVETFRKLWVNFLYIRGFRSDDGFSWKLAVILYILLEFWATWLLQPRVYKRFKDAMVEVGWPWATRSFWQKIATVQQDVCANP